MSLELQEEVQVGGRHSTLLVTEAMEADKIIPGQNVDSG